MKVNSIANCSPLNKNCGSKKQNFGDAYVTLSRANLGPIIEKNVKAYNNEDFIKMFQDSRKLAQKVIDNVNQRLGITNPKIKNVNDLTEKTDLYVLAAGSGSRFKTMATSVAKLRGNGEEFNKISVPFELGKGQQPLTMLDIPMAMGRFFADEKGYSTIIAEQPTGSFGDIVQNYLNTGREPRDVVVCCGDNVFDMKSEEMLDFIVDTINNPQKQLGVVGVARTPEEVKERFGVLKVGAKDPQTGYLPLEGFVEKPPLEVAQTLVTEDGNNVANTGMFVIKQDTMDKFLKIIDFEKNILGGKTLYLAKDPKKEIYDFAEATKKTQAIWGPEASNTKIVKTWEDVGEPEAYLRWIQEVKNGHYLENFTPERKAAILEATEKRVGDNFIQLSNNPKGEDTIKGIRIVA